MYMQDITLILVGLIIGGLTFIVTFLFICVIGKSAQVWTARAQSQNSTIRTICSMHAWFTAAAIAFITYLDLYILRNTNVLYMSLISPLRRCSIGVHD